MEFKTQQQILHTNVQEYIYIYIYIIPSMIFSRQMKQI